MTLAAQGVVWPERNRAELEDYELGEPGPGEVLVACECSLISPGTERAWLGAAPNTPAVFPKRPGYGACGRVLALGEGVEQLAVGDRVIGGGHRSHQLCKAAALCRIDPECAVDSAEAAFCDLACMALQGVRKARIECGEPVLVMGLGLMGLMACQFARLEGALPLLVSDFDATRRELALELGADRAVDPGSDGALDDVRAAAVIEVTGSSAAMHQALAACAPRGRIVALGCARGTTDGINFYQSVHRPGVQIIGAHNCVRPRHDSSPGYWTLNDDRRCFLRALAAGRIRCAPLISRRIAPEQAPEAYAQLASGALAELGVVFDWSSLAAR